jgi:ABC-type cobalt transport system substrate-binding protein
MRKKNIVLIVFLIIFSVVLSSCSANRHSGYHGSNRVNNRPAKELKKSTPRYPKVRKKH